MPGGYHNDGTGRDSYVNNATLTDRMSRVARNASEGDAFWPSPVLSRERARREGHDATLSPQPSPRRGATMFPALSGSLTLQLAGLSPHKGMSPVASSDASSPSLASSRTTVFATLSARGTSLPLGALTARPPAKIESEAHEQMRRGRHDKPASLSPRNDGRLPKLHERLHTTVGVFNEYN